MLLWCIIYSAVVFRIILFHLEFLLRADPLAWSLFNGISRLTSLGGRVYNPPSREPGIWGLRTYGYRRCPLATYSSKAMKKARNDGGRVCEHSAILLRRMASRLKCTNGARSAHGPGPNWASFAGTQPHSGTGPRTHICAQSGSEVGWRSPITHSLAPADRTARGRNPVLSSPQRWEESTDPGSPPPPQGQNHLQGGRRPYHLSPSEQRGPPDIPACDSGMWELPRARVPIGVGGREFFLVASFFLWRAERIRLTAATTRIRCARASPHAFLSRGGGRVTFGCLHSWITLWVTIVL